MDLLNFISEELNKNFFLNQMSCLKVIFVKVQTLKKAFEFEKKAGR